MTLFGNNFNEGVRDRQNDRRDRPIKNGFRQLAKADFWFPGHNARLKERLKGYNTASADIARVDNVSDLMPNIFNLLSSTVDSTRTSGISNQSINITSNQNVNVGSISSGHMEIDELIVVCTNLRKKLQLVCDDFLAIHQSCTENQNAFEEVRLGYSSAIEYLSEQTFIRNSARIFERNQQETDQEIQKLIGIFDNLKTSIISLINQINDIDIVEIDRVIVWLEKHP